MKYYIEDITLKLTGETRTDGKYPRRLHSEVRFIEEPLKGMPLYFDYEKIDEDGQIVQGRTRTGTVDDFDSYSKPGYLFVYTRNNIYTFKELN